MNHVSSSLQFTTLTCIPGVIRYRDAKIQLLDLPGIIEGASEGKGRGRQVIAVAKSSDLIMMVLDASKSEAHKAILTRELEGSFRVVFSNQTYHATRLTRRCIAAVGIRLNRAPPLITFRRKKTGGISFATTVPLSHVDEKLAYNILHEYRIHNADVLFREDASVDDFIDVIEGNRKYIRCLYVYNKIDVLSIEEARARRRAYLLLPIPSKMRSIPSLSHQVDALAHQPSSVPISCIAGLGMDVLLSEMWDAMELCVALSC